MNAAARPRIRSPRLVVPTVVAPDSTAGATSPSELVVFIAAEPGLAERLVAQHVADDHGRCRACPNGAAPNTSWPCTLHEAAVAAQKRRPRTAGAAVVKRGQRAVGRRS